MKFTNLKRGIAGVCAATLLTGMCVAPAFADNTASAENNGAVTGGQGTTAVTIQSQSDQISATVPSAVKLVVGADKNFVSPTDAKITNTGSLMAIGVKSVKATVSSGASLVSDLSSATDANTAVLKISKGNTFDSATAIDLSSATGVDGASLTGWTIDPSSDLGVQFSGQVNKISTLQPISLVSLVWTIG